MLKRLNSFQRNTVGICRSTGFEVTSCQSWRFEKKYATQQATHNTQAAHLWVPDNGITFKVWLTSTLHSFDPQRLKATLLTDLNLLKYILPITGTAGFLRYVLFSQNELISYWSIFNFHNFKKIVLNLMQTLIIIYEYGRKDLNLKEITWTSCQLG